MDISKIQNAILSLLTWDTAFRNIVTCDRAISEMFHVKRAKLSDREKRYWLFLKSTGNMGTRRQRPQISPPWDMTQVTESQQQITHAKESEHCVEMRSRADFQCHLLSCCFRLYSPTAI